MTAPAHPMPATASDTDTAPPLPCNWAAEDMLFVPLGGAGEIGMNANLFHYAGRWLLVDLGITFPDETMPGIDVLMPDLGFITARRDALEGLVVTHGHEDHLGAIPYLWERLQCPIFATPFTLALIRAKLAEYLPDARPEMISLPYNRSMPIGPFTAEFISLTHSIPDPAGLVLKAGGMTLFHTGDWKFDTSPVIGPESDTNALTALGEAGVDVMIGDSTNAMVEGRSGSETEAATALADAIADEKGRVVVTCFASNIARIDSVVRAATANGRTPMLVGRALYRVTEAARSCGYLADWPDLADAEDFDLIPRENLLIICTGSQGEARSALTRIAGGDHYQVALEKGDAVMFSSREIPGNEVAIGKVQDALMQRGIRVITEREAPIHVSGHPAREEMCEMYQMIRPRIAIPVHGTTRHLIAHAELARACQVERSLIPENGAIIRLGKETAEIIGTADTGLVTVEGGAVIPLDGDTMRSRRRMLWNGSVSASVMLDAGGGLMAAPSVMQSGLAEGDRADEYIAEAALRMEDTLENLPGYDRGDDEAVQRRLSSALRALAREMFGRRPPVQVHIARPHGGGDSGNSGGGGGSPRPKKRRGRKSGKGRR